MPTQPRKPKWEKRAGGRKALMTVALVVLVRTRTKLNPKTVAMDLTTGTITTTITTGTTTIINITHGSAIFIMPSPMSTPSRWRAFCSIDLSYHAAPSTPGRGLRVRRHVRRRMVPSTRRLVVCT